MGAMTSAYEKVKAARASNRPTGLAYISNIFSEFTELHGDRRFADDPAIVGGIAMLENQPVTVIAIEKGKDLKEKVRRNFGAPNPEGYRKALRLMHQAEKFSRPVVCFIDTSGAFCGIGAEERGQGQAIAENLMEMMTLRTPVLSILIGEGGSGGALALGVADEVWILENAIYSVISPEGCASILWKDTAKVQDAAQALRLTAQDMKAFGVVERIIPENGADFTAVYENLQKAIAAKLASLSALPKETLLQNRYARFRKFGAPAKTL
ncbi:acetyl-CoA carboxylase carboxyltransferase subunit alpha [Yeguia hominis]|nr:acetyl-CoA carboxylase carboxyltransferase subunit alpha [Yeguia hominis]